MLALLGCVLIFNIVQANWPIFGGDSAHTGYKCIDLLTNGNASLLWKNENLLKPLTYATISNSHYYVINRCGSTLQFSNGCYLNILNANTGNLIESINIGYASSMSPPIVSNGQMIVGGLKNSEVLFVKAYSIQNYYMNVWQATGSAQWSDYPYGVTPSNTDRTIYFSGGEYNGMMYAVDATTGASKFTASLPTSVGSDYWAPTGV